MIFSVAKIAWSLANPLNLTLILLTVACLLMWLRWRRLGLWLVSLITASLLAVAVLPVADWLLAPLTARFAPFAPDGGAVNGIVLLSGAVMDLKISRRVGHAVPGRAADRLVEFIRLARTYPKARLLICGGNVGANGKGRRTEAALIADYLAGRGFPRDRLMIEEQSRDTYENAVRGKALAQPKGHERWLLVTSPWHMPRAMAAFRAQGWPITAAAPMPNKGRPGGFRLRFNLGRGLAIINTALHEYLGLLAYRLNGRGTALWPAPPS
ncbi:MAG: YdcF family protein [Alphaproteobacteria bacterium]